MLTCDDVKRALPGLATGEKPTHELREHLASCDDCRSFNETAQVIARSAETVQSLEGVPGKEIQAVQDHVTSRIRPTRAAFHLAWASAAMLVGVLGTVLVLSGVFGPEDELLWLDGAIFDTTDRKDAEDALKETLDELAATMTFTSSSVGRYTKPTRRN